MIKDNKEIEILITRFQKWLPRALKSIVTNKIEFEAEFAWSKEATPFDLQTNKARYEVG